MRSLIVRDDHLESGFISLSKQIPVPIIDHTLQLPTQYGQGNIRGLLLEEGLYLRYAHVTYREDTEIIRLPRTPESETIFSLCYLLTPTDLQLVLPDTQSTTPLGAANNLLLTANNLRFSIRIPEGILYHTVELLLTQEWLQENLTGMEDKLRAMEEFLFEAPVSPMTDRLRSADRQLLGAIASELAEPHPPLLALRGRLLLLLSGTINRWPGPQGSRPSLVKTWHMQTIRRVEERLLQSLEEMLPSQKQLAKEFALSESTLKRHFKAVYGKTMYEYYLEKKMDLARRMLQEKKVSVSETAYILGYGKVSAFISMFKKVHKVLPGSLK